MLDHFQLVAFLVLQRVLDFLGHRLPLGVLVAHRPQQGVVEDLAPVLLLLLLGQLPALALDQSSG